MDSKVPTKTTLLALQQTSPAYIAGETPQQQREQRTERYRKLLQQLADYIITNHSPDATFKAASEGFGSTIVFSFRPPVKDEEHKNVYPATDVYWPGLDETGQPLPADTSDGVPFSILALGPRFRDEKTGRFVSKPERLPEGRTLTWYLENHPMATGCVFDVFYDRKTDMFKVRQTWDLKSRERREKERQNARTRPRPQQQGGADKQRRHVNRAPVTQPTA